MNLMRGQIYRVNLEPASGGEQQGAARPCVVLSITPFNLKLRTVAVVPLSSSPRPRPPLIIATPSAGKPTSVALSYQIRVADKTRFGKIMGTLSAEDMDAVEDGVRKFLGL